MEITERTEVYKNSRFSVEMLQINSSGKKRRFHIFSIGSGSGVVPITKGGKFVLVREYKVAVNKLLWNWPGGGIESGETIEQAAMREYSEETGDRILSMEFLAELHASPAYINGSVCYFLAEVAGDIKESDDVGVFSCEQVKQMIEMGKIQHSGTIAAFYLALQHIN